MQSYSSLLGVGAPPADRFVEVVERRLRSLLLQVIEEVVVDEGGTGISTAMLTLQFKMELSARLGSITKSMVILKIASREK